MSTDIPSLHYMSPHKDVLTAKPTTKKEKLILIEELKSRGKYSVASQNYPDAQALYSKAIETLATILEDDKNENESSTDNDNATVEDTFTTDQYKKDMAVLYSNRSLCYLKLNNVLKSHDDAMAATVYNPTYVKGYWRLGQACEAKNTNKAALDAFEKACELDPNNKTLRMECDKAKEKAKVESERKINSDPKPNTATPPNNINRTKQPHKVTKNKEDVNIEKPNETLRGYKVVNGKKTSYFHHEQTEEEKRLIGDIAPKHINIPLGSLSTRNEIKENASVWNTAGTWEERDLTTWAVETISKQLKACTYTLPESSPDPGAHIKITKVCMDNEQSPAHISVATVRGKKRYIYEFSPMVEWKAKLSNDKVCTGSITFLDVDSTHEIGEGYDVTNYKVGNETPRDCKYLLETFVRDGGMRGILEKCLDDWVVFFRKNY